MKLAKLPSFIFFFTLLTASQVSFGATQFRVLTGTKTQSFNKSGADQIGGSPLGLLTFVDFEAMGNFYLSFGTSFELSTETYSTSGFSFYGNVMYYLYGSPKAVNSKSGSMNMDLYYPYSIYTNVGVFQKQIKVVPVDTSRSTFTEDLGGLQVGLGLNYNLNPKTYVATHLQMLMSGMSSDSEYSSTEFYIGIGIRL